MLYIAHLMVLSSWEPVNFGINTYVCVGVDILLCVLRLIVLTASLDWLLLHWSACDTWSLVIDCTFAHRRCRYDCNNSKAGYTLHGDKDNSTKSTELNMFNFGDNIDGDELSNATLSPVCSGPNKRARAGRQTTRTMIVKPPLATARAASCNGAVHLFVCLSVAKMQKRDFLKN